MASREVPVKSATMRNLTEKMCWRGGRAACTALAGAGAGQGGEERRSGREEKVRERERERVSAKSQRKERYARGCEWRQGLVPQGGEDGPRSVPYTQNITTQEQMQQIDTTHSIVLVNTPPRAAPAPLCLRPGEDSPPA